MCEGREGKGGEGESDVGDSDMRLGFRPLVCVFKCSFWEDCNLFGCFAGTEAQARHIQAHFLKNCVFSDKTHRNAANSEKFR